MVNVSPALSVTAETVGAGVVPDAHLDDKPVVLRGGRRRRGHRERVLLAHRADACWTKAAGGVLAGVTGADGADAGPVPTALVAVTMNVYAVPFVRPVTVADGEGGLPVTVVGVCATPPT